ncbi:MAG: hypothetical protein HYR64_10890 [Fimbriimonas ginsengisoli]|uniref:O-GlcNAc transferase C-terminal domain-containing protein n=1 Tax=Fimbriimonas ginsengisoli TaxID=1005039 RepID=A0A931LXP5_FIMGI|nr:hypothetical protein [Fimbriimonas ginsengisoli]
MDAKTPDASDSNRSFAESFAAASLARDRSASRLESIVRKIDLIADADIVRRQSSGSPACKAGCDACCHRVVPVTLLEAFRIAARIRESDHAPLAGRIKIYRKETAPFRPGREHEARAACPLLVDGLCSAYDARPLFCRGLSSFDASACALWRDRQEAQIPEVPGQMAAARGVATGLRAALQAAKLDSGLFDLGLVLEAILSDPTLGKRYVEGATGPKEAILDEHIWRDSVDAPATTAEERRPARPALRTLPGDPTGYPDPHPRQTRWSSLCDRGQFENAFKTLTPPRGDAERLLRMRAPAACASEDEIDMWHDRFASATEELGQVRGDASALFDALRLFHTAALGYHGRDVRPLLEPMGPVICRRIAQHSVPDLCEPIEPRKPEGKLRVGHISLNMTHSHSSLWARGWIANHGEDVETYAFNLSLAPDETSSEWERLADHYFHLPGRVPPAARFIKDLKLDVLIYTDIGLTGVNTQFAALRLAPIQCTAWGYPATSGLPTIDYYLSSDLMEPKGSEAHYTERLVRLPGSGLCYWRPSVQPSSKSREELGLPASGPILLCAQHPTKFIPKHDWILKVISDRAGAPMHFVESPLAYVNDVVRRRFEAIGLRALWLPRAEQPDYLRLLQLADVCLDSPGWSGGNTTIDTLMMGTPLVTVPGEFMRGNHSVAFLQIAGAPGLIAKDLDDFVDLACDRGRQQRSMTSLAVDALFDDLAPIEAMDELFLTVTSK